MGSIADSMASTLAAIADFAEEWRQTNRGVPQEDDRLVVAQPRRVMRRRASPYSRPGRFRLTDPEDFEAHSEADSEEDEDPSELRIFLAQEGARTIHEFRVRPFQNSGLSRDTGTTIFEEVVEFRNLRHNMVSYEARYPAAVEVRNILGDEIWNGLEEYRCQVAYLAFSTLLQQSKDSSDFPVGLKAALDGYVPDMEKYVIARWGEDDGELFQCFHNTLKTCIEEDREAGIEIQDGGAMRNIKLWFRRQPIFWLAYNLHFPAEGRMSWEQVSMWAIQWLRRTNMEAPAWPTQLRGLYVWNPDTTTIWNVAVLELFADIRRRFRLSRATLHFVSDFEQDLLDFVLDLRRADD